MSSAADRARFESALRSAIAEFENDEKLIREQYTARSRAGEVPKGEPLDLLERPTRRFLIDRFLRALGWDPDDPEIVSEEARAHKGKRRLYFDYLGLSPGTRWPVLLVEAKGYDTPLPSAPRGKGLDSSTVIKLVCDTLVRLKAGQEVTAILAEWAEWIGDLRDYVVSLETEAQEALQRVVITAGRWMIVFRNPLNAFVEPGLVEAGFVDCFASFRDLLERATQVYELLDRTWLVDTLPLTLSLSDALHIIKPEAVTATFRGVVIATRETGATRRPYPTRSVYPAVIVRSGGRVFAITDYRDHPLEEPTRDNGFASFHTTLLEAGESFFARVQRCFALPDLRPHPISQFPGFPPPRSRQSLLGPSVPPVAGSTAAFVGDAPPAPRLLAAIIEDDVNSSRTHREFVIATDASWFYKSELPSGPQCRFHFRKEAVADGVASTQGHPGCGSSSFTQDGQVRHCAHEELRALRHERCHIKEFESHLCCRVCVFEETCWAFDASKLPCPPSVSSKSNRRRQPAS